MTPFQTVITPWISTHPALTATLMTAFLLTLGFYGAPLLLWTLFGAAVLLSLGTPLWGLGIYFAIGILFNAKIIRRTLLTTQIMTLMKRLQLIPNISNTEKVALDAGNVWVEGELFSGKPNFDRILKETYPELTNEEKAFINGPVEKACELINDWEIWKSKKIPENVLNYLKKEKFFGMIIPKEYGGLGFSALAHSEVVMKLTSRSVPVGITIMVPNSLGPAELLIHYGTEAQKSYYLPRLANGTEIPCFALTEPGAGSDAGSIKAEGVVFKGPDGKLYLRLNWNKRWITLASISTLLGLAFKLKDPLNLLGKGTDLGITCALIPSETPGVVLGRRHDPMGIPFHNCPTQGQDVVVSIDAIVGGVEGAGQGWKMLMECLSAGRGISLPSQGVGAAKMATRVVSAHAVVRKQFGQPIGKFEGVEEPMARIAAAAYWTDAMRKFTLGAIDNGVKPPIVTAMAKFHQSESKRKVINDAMDVLGGAGISRGPRNVIGNIYFSLPISVTVEGANILTRTLMIFGQGAFRAHPYAYKEIKALSSNDLVAFDDAFWRHVGHVVRNMTRSLLLSLTRGRIARSPSGGATAVYYKRLSWSSASFAALSDLAMAVYGGKLKLREKMTGRFADIFSLMYIGASVLRRFEHEGRREEDLPFVHYSMNKVFKEMDEAFEGLLSNIEVPGLTWLFKKVLAPWSNFNRLTTYLSDDLSHTIVTEALYNDSVRDRLTEGIYVPQNSNDTIGRIDHARDVVLEADKVDHRIKVQMRAGRFKTKVYSEILDEALKLKLISPDELQLLREAEAVRWNAIQVDDFSEEEYNASGALERSSPILSHEDLKRNLQIV